MQAIIASGSADEVAALVVALQERQKFFCEETALTELSKAICDRQQEAPEPFENLH